jgi:hypothetical protein
MVTELRVFTINKGRLDDFVRAWTAGVYPLRLKKGYRVEGAWVIRERNEFIWLLSHDGGRLGSAGKSLLRLVRARRGDPRPRAVYRQDREVVSHAGDPPGVSMIGSWRRWSSPMTKERRGERSSSPQSRRSRRRWHNRYGRRSRARERTVSPASRAPAPSVAGKNTPPCRGGHVRSRASVPTPCSVPAPRL